MRKATLIVSAVLALALLALPATSMARDRNHDKLPDKWEKKFHLSLAKNQAKKDQDHDGLNNKQEFKDGTNPRDADTDNDGMKDGQEVEVGDNPRDADTDNDGTEDGDEIAGTVQSFDSGTGTLTILLPDGTTTRSGTVNGNTRIECDGAENENETGDDSGVHSASHGSDDGSGDNSGPGSTSSGPGSDGSGDDRQACSTADLTPGRVVHEAKFTTDASGAVTFTKVELDK